MRFLPFALSLAAMFGLVLPAPGAAQGAPMPTVQLTAGIHLITAEVAASPDAVARGLMFRRSLAPNHGMLFIFDRKAAHCMWMRNTLIPLSVAFIEDDGTIVNVRDMKPHDETRQCAGRPVRYALEMTEGWFASRGLGAGAKLGRLPAPGRP